MLLTGARHARLNDWRSVAVRSPGRGAETTRPMDRTLDYEYHHFGSHTSHSRGAFYHGEVGMLINLLAFIFIIVH